MRSFVPRILLISAVAFLVYSNTFRVPFTFDETVYIENNPAVRDLSYYKDPSKIDKTGSISPAVKQSFRTRMLGHLTLALNFKLHGYDVAGYHIFNLALHISNSILVYLLLLLTFRTPLFRRKTEAGTSPPYDLIALFPALIFSAHPVQTEAVTYIAQRFTLLAAFFYLLSLVLYVRARLAPGPSGYLLFPASAICAVLAMITKENAFTLPFVVAIYEFIFFEGSIKKRINYLLPILLTMPIIPLMIFFGGQGKGIDETMRTMGVSQGISRLDYLLTQFRVIVTYIRLIFLPVGLNLDYDYPVFKSVFEPEVFASLVFLLSIAGVGVYILFRSLKHENPGLLRLLSFGIFWFFATLSVESSIVPLADMIFEYRLYLPLAGFIPALIVGGFLLAERLKINRKALFASLIAVVLALSAAAYARNSLWQDPVRLWEDTARKSPLKARPHFNLGISYLKKGRLREAEREFKAAIALMPGNPEFHEHLANFYEREGRLPEALAQLERAIALKPDFARAHNLMGIVLSREGRLDEAEMAFSKAIALQPDYAEAHGNIAIFYEQRGNTERAFAAYQNAVRLNPGNPDIRNALGSFYLRQGRLAEAAMEFEAALRSDPSNAYAIRNLRALGRK